MEARNSAGESDCADTRKRISRLIESLTDRVRSAHAVTRTIAVNSDAGTDVTGGARIHAAYLREANDLVRRLRALHARNNPGKAENRESGVRHVG